MNEQNTHADITFLSLAQELLEGSDPQGIPTRLEEMKELVLPCSRAQRARYTQLLQEVAGVTALEELAGQDIGPISRAAFQSLEQLEAQTDDCPLKAWGQEDDFAGENLTTVAAHIDTADSPEIIRAVTAAVLHTIACQKGGLEQKPWYTSVRRMLEEKILMDETPSHPSRALSLWNALRRSPVRDLAIPLLWYDEEKACFYSAASEDLTYINTLG